MMRHLWILNKTKHEILSKNKELGRQSPEVFFAVMNSQSNIRPKQHRDLHKQQAQSRRRHPNSNTWPEPTNTQTIATQQSQPRGVPKTEATNSNRRLHTKHYHPKPKHPTTQSPTGIMSHHQHQHPSHNHEYYRCHQSSSSSSPIKADVVIVIVIVNGHWHRH